MRNSRLHQCRHTLHHETMNISKKYSSGAQSTILCNFIKNVSFPNLYELTMSIWTNQNFFMISISQSCFCCQTLKLFSSLLLSVFRIGQWKIVKLLQRKHISLRCTLLPFVATLKNYHYQVHFKEDYCSFLSKCMHLFDSSLGCCANSYFIFKTYDDLMKCIALD